MKINAHFSQLINSWKSSQTSFGTKISRKFNSKTAFDSEFETEEQMQCQLHTHILYKV